MNQAIILFTHIPKTGGTSVKKSLINVQISNYPRFKGFINFFFRNHSDIRFLNGHYPYGIHHFIRGKRERYYFVLMREPLDQAISYYYFVRQCDGVHYQHPDLKDAKKYSIDEFYKIKKYQNIQTKFIAGFPCNMLLKTLPNQIGSKVLLKYAKNNLNYNYNFFGFLENIDLCQEVLASELKLPNLKIKDTSKITQRRPKSEDLDMKTRKIIAEANSLDFHLYRYAQSVFCKRFSVKF